MEARNTDKSNEAPISPPLEKRLMAISDITLGVMIAAFFPYCDPPQRKYPINKREKPVWWPESEPYKEPNNLKKKAKVNVLAAIIESLIPNFAKMEKAVRKTKSLEKTISSLESYIWSSILTYLKEGHNKSHDVPVPVSTSAGPSVSPAEKKMRDKKKEVLQDAPQGERKYRSKGLPNIDPDVLYQQVTHESYDQEFWRFMNNNQK